MYRSLRAVSGTADLVCMQEQRQIGSRHLIGNRVEETGLCSQYLGVYSHQTRQVPLICGCRLYVSRPANQPFHSIHFHWLTSQPAAAAAQSDCMQSADHSVYPCPRISRRSIHASHRVQTVNSMGVYRYVTVSACAIATPAFSHRQTSIRTGTFNTASQ